VVFTQVSEKDRVAHIWRVDADGKDRGSSPRERESANDLPRRRDRFLRSDDPGTVWSLDPVTGGEAKKLASNTTGELASISPDRRLVMYLDFTVVQERLYARINVIPSAGGGLVAQFLLPPGATVSTWSPDSRSMTYIDRNKAWNLMRQPIAGGAPAAMTRFSEGVTTGFAWSPDGARIAVVRRIGQKCGLWSIQPDKGDPILLAEFRSGAITEPCWTPDSKNVFFVYGTSSKDVVLISDFQNGS
jgi:WD40 repeat protein